MTWPHKDPDFEGQKDPEDNLRGCRTCGHKKRELLVYVCGHPQGPRREKLTRTDWLFGCKDWADWEAKELEKS